MLQNILAMIVGLALCILCALANPMAAWQFLLLLYGALVFIVGVIEALSDLKTDIDSLFDFGGRFK